MNHVFGFVFIKGTLAWWISTPIDDTAISRYVL